MNQEIQEYIPIGLLMLVAIGFAIVNLLAPTIIGKKRTHDPVKDSPYECGLPPMTSPHTRFSVKFYLIAMLFILFDIEVVFLLGWSSVFRDLVKPVGEGGIGMAMMWGAVIFLIFLEIGHIYAWKKGALDWAPARSKNSVNQPNSVTKSLINQENNTGGSAESIAVS